MGLFVPEWLDRIRFGENGPTVSKVENWQWNSKWRQCLLWLSSVWKTFIL